MFIQNGSPGTSTPTGLCDILRINQAFPSGGRGTASCQVKCNTFEEDPNAARCPTGSTSLRSAQDDGIIKPSPLWEGYKCKTILPFEGGSLIYISNLNILFALRYKIFRLSSSGISAKAIREYWKACA